MASNATNNHNPADLCDLEREVLQLVWQSGGQVTADGVRESLPRKLKESTLRTVLKRLEEKGYLTHDVEGRTFLIDRPAESERRSFVCWRQSAWMSSISSMTMVESSAAPRTASANQRTQGSTLSSR